MNWPRNPLKPLVPMQTGFGTDNTPEFCHISRFFWGLAADLL
jgi:hypothetical protein